MLTAPFPGAFASYNPRAAVVAGGGSFRSGPDGLIAARFGWADPITGFANNSRSNDGELLGLVQPASGFMRWASAWGGLIIRPGYQVILYSMGDFWARFVDGAEPGAHVYASIVDGSPVAGYTQPDDTELTPWDVIIGAEPGGLAVISTWSKFQ